MGNYGTTRISPTGGPNCVNNAGDIGVNSSNISLAINVDFHRCKLGMLTNSCFAQSTPHVELLKNDNNALNELKKRKCFLKGKSLDGVALPIDEYDEVLDTENMDDEDGTAQHFLTVGPNHGVDRA